MTEIIEPEPKDWRERRKKRLLIVSASQLETFRLCRRKWWLDKIRNLEIKSTTSQVFGTVLHAVCERYLLADDLGRGPNGQAVDLYPPGWEVAPARFGKPSEGTVTPAEADLIRRLIAKAIEEGVLERLPGRIIEGEFRRTVVKLPCPDCNGSGEEPLGEGHKCPTCKGDGNGTHVQIMGFIDESARDRVSDHKSTKNMRYAKSAKALAENVQMLSYGHEIVERAKDRQEPPPQNITLRHNVFCKDPAAPKVRKTEVAVTREYVENEWTKIVADTKDMVTLRDSIEIWHDIQNPVNPSYTCNAYGGCPFRSICAGHETEQDYEKRLAFISKLADNASNPSVAVTVEAGQRKIAMGFEDALARKKAIKDAANGVTVAPPVNPPAPAAVAAPVIAAPAAPVIVTPAVAAPAAAIPAPVAPGTVTPPPWAASDCPACKGVGFNSKGGPCRICDSKMTAAKKETSAAYNVAPLGDGKVFWQHKTNEDYSGESWMTGNPALQVAAPAAVVPAAVVDVPPPAPVIAAPAVIAPAAASPAAPASPPALGQPLEDEEDGKKGAGRPKKGFILIQNALVTKGAQRLNSGRGVHHLHEVFTAYGAELAKVSNVASYFDLDAFKRRDELAKAAPAIAATFGADFVVCSGVGNGGNPDITAFYNALRPYAGMEIVAEK